MGKKRASIPKLPKIKDAEITEDGAIIVEFNHKVFPATNQCLFTADALLSLADEYAEIPNPNFNDFPGVPVVTEEAIFEYGDEEERIRKPKTEEDGELDPEPEEEE